LQAGATKTLSFTAVCRKSGKYSKGSKSFWPNSKPRPVARRIVAAGHWGWRMRGSRQETALDPAKQGFGREGAAVNHPPKRGKPAADAKFDQNS
jgi:hypothetical protein